jgi:hypothetical protein
VFILGPAGVGKTKVALRLAQPAYSYFDRYEIEREIEDLVRSSRSSMSPMRTAPAVVLESPQFLGGRHGPCRVLVNLIHDRVAEGLKTIICQPEDPRSMDHLLSEVDPGNVVVLGLRFPQGSRGRQRVARRMCETMNIPPAAAKGTENLEPWNYARVQAQLEQWKRVHPEGT